MNMRKIPSQPLLLFLSIGISVYLLVAYANIEARLGTLESRQTQIASDAESARMKSQTTQVAVDGMIVSVMTRIDKQSEKIDELLKRTEHR